MRFLKLSLCFEGTCVSCTVQAGRCLKGEAPKKDETSTHGMGLSGTDFQKAKHELGADGNHKPWNQHQSKETLFEHCGARGIHDLQKEELQFWHVCPESCFR